MAERSAACWAPATMWTRRQMWKRELWYIGCRYSYVVRTALAPAADAGSPHVDTSVYGREVEIKVPSPQQAALAGLLT